MEKNRIFYIIFFHVLETLLARSSAFLLGLGQSNFLDFSAASVETATIRGAMITSR